MDAIFTRRSVRRFKSKPVEKGRIEKLLKAAMQAPSAGNQQPWEFIVVTEPETLKKLAKISPYAKMTAEAGAAVVVLGNKEGMRFPENWQQDLSAATQNLLLEAVNLKLGAVWLGVAPLEERMEFITDFFNLSENLLPFSLIAIGYPEGQGNYFTDRFDASRIHYETYKN